MNKKIKLVIFDLDGTLVEFPRDYLFNEVERILPILSLPSVTRDTLNEAFRNFDFFSFLNEENRQKLIEAYWEFFDWSNYPSSVAFPFSRQLLKDLKKLSYKCCIATARATNKEEIIADLENAELLDCFSEVVFRESKSLDWKNKVPQIEKVLSLHNVLASEAIMVGDTPPDIISANKIGLAASVAVLSGGIYKDVLLKSKPTYVLNDVRELPSVLDKLS